MPKKSHKKLLHKGKGSSKKSQKGSANRSKSKQPLSMMKGGDKVLEYNVIIHNNLSEFIIKVNAELAKGWQVQLQGGVSMNKAGFYMQAITKVVEQEGGRSKVYPPQKKSSKGKSRKQLSVMKGGGKVLDYNGQQSEDLEGLKEQVNRQLKDGWELRGDIFVNKAGAYMQAITKERELYQVENVETVPKLVFTDVKFNKGIGDRDDYVIIEAKTNIETKTEIFKSNICHGLNIQITDGKNTILSQIKSISSNFSGNLNILFEKTKDLSKDLSKDSTVTLTIKEFQKIILSEEVTDKKIGDKISINYRGAESTHTIKAMGGNEIVFNSPINISTSSA